MRGDHPALNLHMISLSFTALVDLKGVGEAGVNMPEQRLVLPRWWENLRRWPNTRIEAEKENHAHMALREMTKCHPWWDCHEEHTGELEQAPCNPCKS